MLTPLVLGSARFFTLEHPHARPPACSCSRSHTPGSLGSNPPCARFAASWYRSITPWKFLRWLNALQFYSNNRVLEGSSSLESGELPTACPKSAFGWFSRQGCLVTCSCCSSAGAAPGFLCKLQMGFNCRVEKSQQKTHLNNVNQGVTSGSGKHRDRE